MSIPNIFEIRDVSKCLKLNAFKKPDLSKIPIQVFNFKLLHTNIYSYRSFEDNYNVIMMLNVLLCFKHATQTAVVYFRPASFRKIESLLFYAQFM